MVDDKKDQDAYERNPYLDSMIYKIRWMMMRAQPGEQLSVLFKCSVMCGFYVGADFLLLEDARKELYFLIGLLMCPGYSIEGAARIIDAGLIRGTSNKDAIDEIKRKAEMVNSVASATPIETNKDGYKWRMIKKQTTPTRRKSRNTKSV